MTHLIVALGLVGLALLGVVVARTLWRLRGPHLVECPETHRPAAVELDRRYAALGALVGRPVLRLRSCSRWPERRHCGEPCLDELEAAPADQRVRNVLARWYEGKRCVFCGGHFAWIHWHDHAPALLAPDNVLREWSELASAELPDALATHRPVCWNCLIVHRLRRQRPDLFVSLPPLPHPHGV